jgi:hypothetical protein
MGGKLSVKAQQRLDVLVQGRRKLDRIHSLVEQYASGGKGTDSFAGMIARAASEAGRLFLGNGLGVMGDHANQLAMLARRGGTTQTKFRGLRELVVNLRGALDRAEKAVVADDAEPEDTHAT